MHGHEIVPRSGGSKEEINNNEKSKATSNIFTENKNNDEDFLLPETKKARLCNAEPASGDNDDGDGYDSPSKTCQDSGRKGFTPSPSTATDGNSNNIRWNETLPTTRWLLLPNGDCNGGDCLAARLPPSLFSPEKKKIGQDHDRFAGLLNQHGLRTSKISSPREAVSIYKDSCCQGDDAPDDSYLKDGKDFLLVTFGLYPQQHDLEKYYKTCIKNAYCLLLFCKKMREEYDGLLESSSSSSSKLSPSLSSNSLHVLEQSNNIASNSMKERLQILIFQIEKTTNRLMRESSSSTKTTTSKDHCGFFSSRSAHEQVAALIKLATSTKGKRRYRAEEWKKEYQRICVSNSTISNAYLFLLQSIHGICIQDILLKYNPKEPKYERITIYFYDPAIDYRKPSLFLFLPGLHTVLTKGPHELVSEMMESFWSHVLRNGYFPTTAIQQVLESQLRSFFVSGLVTATTGGSSNSYLPLPLKADFVPSSPLSIYIHGKAGVGKSSLAKVLPMALQSTLEQHMDPKSMARFVKQNLNKRLETLELEFQPRPNNNDMSVMSIIQARRMTMSQSKAGLVVLNLEEMPSFMGNNPDQESVAQLISQRFGGRKGNYQPQEQNNKIVNINGFVNSSGRNNPAPRNSDKRSIGQDYSLVTIFTSNYPLAENSKAALAQLELYQSLTPIEMFSITGSDRYQFAKSYLSQCLIDSFGEDFAAEITTRNIVLDIVSISNDGDTRPLVRQLRMFSYYLRTMLENIIVQKAGHVTVEEIRVLQNEKDCILTVQTKIGRKANRNSSQQLTMGSLINWYPAGPFIFDSKIKMVINKLKTIIDDEKAAELAVILEFWISMTLAPAVILSRDKKIIEQLVNAIECMGEDVNCIKSVDAQTYKMIKSLYDPKEMPNLRDDILKFGRGSLVATELRCPTGDSQLCIREMIEDSPSMTAFSSMKSALNKSGLLFAIYVEGEVTPEVLSRVSFVL